MSQQIFKATYSGVPVYELSCNGVAVMRRKNDSYMNATQILKVADFDKPQRTRILEREVQIDEHEKIQGGYGKYQGTWVPLENAARLARNYSVDDLIRPLLEFVKGDESPPLAPKHVTAVSAKPRKPRERRPRKKTRHLDDDGSDINDDSGLSAKEDNAQTPSPRRQHRRAAAAAMATTHDPIESDTNALSDPGGDLQSKTTRHSRHKRTKLDTQLDFMDVDELDNNDDDDTKMTEKSEPITTKAKQQQTNKASHADKSDRLSSSSPLSSPDLSPSASTSTPLLPSSSTGRMATPTTATTTTKHKTKKGMEHERTYAHKLLAHFLSENEDIPALLQRPPRDLDVNIIIDEDGHTCLHWAAVMGHMATVQQLIQLDVDLYRVNYKGQTALMRSVLYTNNYDQKTFQQLLGLLSGTIFNIDKSDQTVFHHVAATAIGKGKTHASRYYMENLINKLVHNRSELISILNVQDVCGDTALTIASRIGNRRLVRLLIDAGASTEIANEEGMTSQDYLETLDHHSVDKSRMNEDLSATSATMTASQYQSEETTREKVRQKVDSMYKAMLAGNTTATTPSVSQWVDDLASSYERDLNKKEITIKEKLRDTEMAIKRLDETKNSLKIFSGDDDQQLQQTLDHGDRLAQELRQVLLCIQETRLGKWIKERDGGMKDGLTSSQSLSATETASTPMDTDSTTDADDLSRDPESKSEKNNNNNNNNDTNIENGDDKANLENQLGQLQQTRRQLINDIITHRSKICDKRIRNYKQLISMCCNVAYENVDSLLVPILTTFDEANEMISAKETPDIESP